jgi:hypothetical protein
MKYRTTKRGFLILIGLSIERNKMITIKSRKHHKEIRIGDTGIFVCPKQKQRPQVTVEICKGRQGRRHRGCVTCKVPQQVERKQATEKKRNNKAERATGNTRNNSRRHERAGIPMVTVELKSNRDIGNFIIIERRRDLDAQEKESRRCSRCGDVHNDDIDRLVLTEKEAKELAALLSMIK